MSQDPSINRPRARLSASKILLAGLGLLLLVAGLGIRWWWPRAQALLTVAANSPATENSHRDAHDNRNAHGHPNSGEVQSIDLSEQARKNIGLQLGQVELRTFVRTIEVPGMVVERPGFSTVEVTAPLTGVVTRIYVMQGQTVAPGDKLFELRLTHEELVQSQAELLQTAEELEVLAREILRIQELTESAGLAGKQLLERQYERQKIEVVLRSRRQALILHGFSEEQIDAILKSRELLRDMTVFAPSALDGDAPSASAELYQAIKLNAAPGRHVTAGDTLFVLADHAELFIQGEAFERDVREISRAAEARAEVSAALEAEQRVAEHIQGLRILYLASNVNAETRTLDFYVALPNEIERDATLASGARFVSWKYRPGQRVQLFVPVESFPERIVLPLDALAQDGVESFVFVPNGGRFDRRAVHVEYRDTRQVVIANDGALFPGEMVVLNGAQQLQLALKNQAGGTLDPHAGHTH